MADLTAAVQKPGLTAVAPVYSGCAAADFFTAQPNASYILHYKNGATAQTTGPNKVADATSQAPAGATVAGGWADVAHGGGGGMAATSELVLIIPNSNRFRDGQGRINLTHPGTLTTVSVCILGPLPAMV
jgi:hypothetical protein